MSRKIFPRSPWIGLTAALAVAVLGGAWFYRTQKLQHLHAAEANLRTTARLKADQIYRWRNERLGDGKVLMKSRPLGEGLSDPATDRESLLDFLEIYREGYSYSDVLLTDPEGNILISLAGGAGELHPAGLAALTQAVRERRAVLTDLHYGSGDGEIHIAVIVPLFAPGGEVARVVFLQSNARDFLFPLIQDSTVTSETAETLLVRRDGDDVLFLNDLRHRDGTALALRLPLDRPDLPAALAISGQEGTVRGKDYRDEPVLAVLQPVPGSEWFVISKVDTAEVLSAFRPRALLFPILAVALLLIAAALAGMIQQRNQKSYYRTLARVQEERDQTAQEHLQLLENMINAFAIFESVFNEDGEFTSYRFEYINAAYERITGIARDEVRGRTVHQVWPGTEPSWGEAYGSVAVSGTPREFEMYHDPTGKLYHCYVYRPWESRNRFCVVFDDITDRKRTEGELRRLNRELEDRVAERTKELESSNRELEAFAYSVSHDLRAPLRAIEGFSRILEEDYGKRFDGEGKRLLRIVRDNTRKMDRLITDLLELSRAGRTEMDFSRVEMGDLATEIFREIASPEIREKFDFIIGPLPPARGDRVLLGQVWRNLIDNAIKYTLPGPVRRIEIAGRREGEWNVYSVRDSGVGFDPRYADKLFGVFQRLHTSAEFPGTGIGLALVERIIRRHGGRIEAESEPDQGALFRFYLPAGQKSTRMKQTSEPQGDKQ
ncbi:MAG: ATP-binding protein [Candidatus Erginobacter occultus]|nr:ATP-binding protein [Candidatus Erginobacter occultus]